MNGIKKVEVSFQMEDGCNATIDITDKKYINLQDMKQQQEIAYLNRKLEGLKKDEVKK